MPRSRPARAVSPSLPGEVTGLCPCGSGIGSGSLKPSCRKCWLSLPPGLREDWEQAGALGAVRREKAVQAIREHLARQTAGDR